MSATMTEPAAPFTDFSAISAGFRDYSLPEMRRLLPLVEAAENELQTLIALDESKQQERGKLVATLDAAVAPLRLELQAKNTPAARKVQLQSQIIDLEGDYGQRIAVVDRAIMQVRENRTRIAKAASARGAMEGVAQSQVGPKQELDRIATLDAAYKKLDALASDHYCPRDIADAIRTAAAVLGRERAELLAARKARLYAD